ncbi:glycosyltransferase family 4 protein [Bdellovibrio sp. KM01]|uniref:glycosyltransferase family 4 protein n=1 Tax=Bdellovibrio sp. KM01 TaxID=2748865 RepID=UPI0015EA6F61|nr:MraY family glycosyltransferase [Bdellovibrio sp. KM01]QLY27057.1 undecaprenyl/decaprenyl-phosphate alpha-N-acetylglucosaminyl 1-phosphate transferase [Bdellovibrio sp. KM01]
MLFLVFGPFVVSMLIASFSIPAIIKVADLKHLMDEPDSDRKLHSNRTPTLGGIAIFAGTLFSFSAFTDYLSTSEVKFMIPALVLLFFAGMKDDILILSPFKKLGTQIFCAMLITILGDLRLTSLWGMFGISEIAPLVGITLSSLVIVALINAFNLIDGVDGLAGGLGIIAAIFFGIWFTIASSPTMTILSFSLAGSLLGFLIYNFRKAKIFMGDTGSMILGFIIAILALRFIEANRIPGFETSPYYIKAAPGVAVAAVIIPLLDMVRVFFFRILRKRSPFTADRNHIHHALLDLKMSHVKISLILYTASIFAIALSLLLRQMRSMDLVIILIVTFMTIKVATLRYRTRCCAKRKTATK